MAIPFLSDISGQGATFAGNLTIQKDDPTITLYNNGGANTDPNGTIIFSESNNVQNFDINYNGASDRLEFRGRVGNSDNTDLVLINRDLTTTLQVLGGATFTGGVTVQNNLTLTKTSGNNQLYINSSGGGAPVIYFEDPNRKWGQFVSNGHLYFKDETANVTSLKIDGVTAAAAFAGDVTVNRSVNTSSPIITISNDDSKHMKMGVVRSAAGTAPNTSFIAYDGDFRLIPGSGNSTEKFTLNSSGNATFAGDVTVEGGQIYINDTNTKLEEGTGNAFRVTTDSGYIDIGPKNTGHCHIETNRTNFYFNKELRVNTGIISSYDEDLSLQRASSDDGSVNLNIGMLYSTSINDSQLQLGGFTLNTGLEDTYHVYMPGVSPNAFAGAHRRLTVTATKNGASISAASLANAFLAHEETYSVSTANTDTIIIEISGFGLNYGQWYGIAFGSLQWRAKDIDIEVSSDNGSNYTSIYSENDQPHATVRTNYSSGSTLINKIKYTLTNWNTASTRINHIFGYKYLQGDTNYLDKYRDETMYSSLNFRDVYAATFGNSGDLVIKHTGSDSIIETHATASAGDLYIKSQGTNHDLYLQAADDIFIRPQNGENGIKVHGNDNVELYFNNVRKLRTTSTGINVEGDVVATGLDINGAADISGNATFAGDVNAPGLVYNASTKYLSISHWSSPPTPAAMLHLSDNSNSLDVPQIRIEGRENPGDTVLDIAVKDADVRFNLVEGSTDAASGYGRMHFKTNASANSSNPTRGGFLFQSGPNSSLIDVLDITNEGNATFAGAVNMASGKITSDGSAAAGAYLELKHANNNSTDVCATINLTNNAGGYAAIVGGTTGANDSGYIQFKTDNAGTQSTVLTLNHDNKSVFNGNVEITGDTASPHSDNAFLVLRGSDGSNAFRVQNSGEVVVQNNYLYAAGAGTSLYVQAGAVIRGDISNDGGDVRVADNLVVTGNLTVDGTTTTLNTQTVEVEDNILQLNTTQGSPDTATAATSGISIYRGDGVTQASFIFDDGDDTWDLTNNLKVAGTSFLDGLVTIDHNLNIQNNGVIKIAGTEVISAARAINSASITALAKGVQLGSSGYYINSTFKDTADNVGVFLAHNDTANGVGAIAGINQLAFLTYGSAWTQALLLDSSQNATFAGNVKIKNALIDNASVTSATATTVVASVAHATYNAAFFDFVIKNGTNVRAGTVYACHNGASTPLVEFAETSTVDLGDTSDVTLNVVISGTNMVLQATTTSSTWTIKALIRGI